MMRADLARYVEILEEQYDNNNLQDLKIKSLEEIVRLIEQPGSQALPHGDVARRLAMHDGAPDRASRASCWSLRRTRSARPCSRRSGAWRLKLG